MRLHTLASIQQVYKVNDVSLPVAAPPKALSYLGVAASHVSLLVGIRSNGTLSGRLDYRDGVLMRVVPVCWYCWSSHWWSWAWGACSLWRGSRTAGCFCLPWATRARAFEEFCGGEWQEPAPFQWTYFRCCGWVSSLWTCGAAFRWESMCDLIFMFLAGVYSAWFVPSLWRFHS